MSEFIRGNFGRDSTTDPLTIPLDLVPDLSAPFSENDVDRELQGLVANIQMLSEPLVSQSDVLNAEQAEAQRLADRRALFGDIVDLTHKEVYATVGRVCKFDPDVTQEVVQDTYLRAWRSIDKFRGDCAVAGWLCRIAMNRALTTESLRRRLASRTIELVTRVNEMTIHAGSSPEYPIETIPDKTAQKPFEDIEIRHDLTNEMRQALANLSLSQRQVVVLHAIEGRSHPEIATILGIEEEASKQRYHRGLKKLRQQIGPSLELWRSDNE